MELSSFFSCCFPHHNSQAKKNNFHDDVEHDDVKNNILVQMRGRRQKNWNSKHLGASRREWKKLRKKLWKGRESWKFKLYFISYPFMAKAAAASTKSLKMQTFLFSFRFLLCLFSSYNEICYLVCQSDWLFVGKIKSRWMDVNDMYYVLWNSVLILNSSDFPTFLRLLRAGFLGIPLHYPYSWGIHLW